jgi:hypothetical protein
LRVVHLLRTSFIPVRISALNTPACLADPRDQGLLASYVRPETDDFDGGEREAFLLPDGTMLPVFMSLHGPDAANGCLQMTGAGRRSDLALQPFREHAEQALRRTHGGVAQDWAQLWSGEHPSLRWLAEEPARWPMPTRGAQALRVFVRNSYRQYDDLHGCELVPLEQDALDALCSALREGAAAVLPGETFVALGRAMVPRGQVATRLRAESISGALRLCAEERATDRVTGTLEGSFALHPATKSEVGARENAASRFRSRGRLVGRFMLDLEARRFVELRAAAADVEIGWISEFPALPSDFAPRHQVAIEAVGAPFPSGPGGD